MDEPTNMMGISSELHNLNLNIIELIEVLKNNKNDDEPSFILVCDERNKSHWIMKAAIKEVTLDAYGKNTVIEFLDGSSITLNEKHKLYDTMKMIDGG